MNKKTELRKEFLSLIKNKLSKKVDFNSLDKKFDTVLESLSRKMETQILTRVEPNVHVENLKEVMTEVLENVIDSNKKQIDLLIKSQSKEITAHLGKQPSWWKNAPDEVTIKNKEFIFSKSEKQRKEDMSFTQSMLTSFFSGLVDFFTKLQQKTYKASLPLEHYTTPQQVILLDPRTMKPLDPKDIGEGVRIEQGQGPTQGGNAGPASISIRGSNSIGDGNATVTTAGVRQQLPNQKCTRVRIQAHPDNVGDIVVGGSSVVANSATRQGLALFSSQWAEFAVDNLNRLYIDSTEDGDKLNYIYEYTI